MNPLDLIKFVEAQTQNEQEQLEMLAALADAPSEDFASKMRLPVQNKIPSFHLGRGDVGSSLTGKDYGVPAPVIDAPPVEAGEDIGQLLIGE